MEFLLLWLGDLTKWLASQVRRNNGTFVSTGVKGVSPGWFEILSEEVIRGVRTFIAHGRILELIQPVSLPL
jgi:hypothetical protein